MKIKSATSSYSPKLILEMGGSNPIIVCESADIKKAATIIAESAISNSGQRCASASRLIVHDSISEEMMTLLEEKITAMLDVNQRETFSGCLVDINAKNKHEDLLKKARTSGSIVLEFDYEKRLGRLLCEPCNRT